MRAVANTMFLSTGDELGDDQVVCLDAHCGARLGIGSVEGDDPLLPAGGEYGRAHFYSLAVVAAELRPLGREPLARDVLVERWHRLPLVDPGRLRTDIDELIEPAL